MSCIWPTVRSPGVKTVPDGICLNGAHARTVDRVAAGDVLTVRIDDKRSGGKFTPVAVPLDHFV